MLYSFHSIFTVPGPHSAGAAAAAYGLQEHRFGDRALKSPAVRNQPGAAQARSNWLPQPAHFADERSLRGVNDI